MSASLPSFIQPESIANLHMSSGLAYESGISESERLVQTQNTNSLGEGDGSDSESVGEDPYYWDTPEQEHSFVKKFTHNAHWLAFMTWEGFEAVGDFFAEALGLYDSKYEWALERHRKEENERRALAGLPPLSETPDEGEPVDVVETNTATTATIVGNTSDRRDSLENV